MTVTDRKQTVTRQSSEHVMRSDPESAPTAASGRPMLLVQLVELNTSQSQSIAANIWLQNQGVPEHPAADASLPVMST